MTTTQSFHIEDTEYTYYPVASVDGVEKMPYTLRILIENVLRNGGKDAQRFAERIVEAGAAGKQGSEIEYMPARVLLQDFTGVPVFVDLAAMRDAAVELGGNPKDINPQIPLDLVIDHSVIADSAGCATALDDNMNMEFARNNERYRFLKWAQSSFSNVRIVPPGQGICHQINVERFATGVMTSEDVTPVAYFDTVVGTDSHTTTANGIGVLSWGVGGIEAEAACLGQPITTLVPEVIGVRLIGKLSAGVSAMDVALVFANVLRAKGVVGKFVECYGEGLASLSATQRATIANMTPEYGSTCTFFPFDEQTIDYLRLTGRSEAQVALVESYAKAQGLWASDDERTYSDVIEIDLSAIGRNLAGPSRPHDRIDFDDAQQAYRRIAAERNLDDTTVEVDMWGETHRLTHGAIAIAAVTSCTTATDPAMMVACGVLARNAHKLGLESKPWVKRVFAPGSHATYLLLERAGLGEGLNALGFHLCGFGCMSCIGNSGPIWPQMHDVATTIELTSVLSGNRNFEGRISPDVSQNYLAAPAAVIAYALAGAIDFDFEHEPLGTSSLDGSPVYLRDIWPDDKEIASIMDEFITQELFDTAGASLYEGGAAWQNLEVEASDLFTWDENSTYVRKAPYFDGMKLALDEVKPIDDARVLAKLGDFITTDHISPAGAIAADSPAATYLREHGVEPEMFNTYGSRRGNHEVMARGGFANVKLTNELADGKKGGYTFNFETDKVDTIFDTAQRAQELSHNQVILAGKMYGSGSSRDWAAKAPLLLGVRAVFAESFERIHRSNLIGMGILPLEFQAGENADTLGLTGVEQYTIEHIDFGSGVPYLPEPRVVHVTARQQNGEEISFSAKVRVDTPTEGAYMAHGGILQYVLRSLIAH